MIESVEQLRPDFEVGSLLDGDVLEERQSKVNNARSSCVGKGPCNVADGEIGRISEGIRVEPPRGSALRVGKAGIANHVGPVDSGEVIGAPNPERKSSLEGADRVDLPASDDVP